jgi:hypothetical protein
MTKHRQTRKRNQKGGAWYNPLSWGQNQDLNAPKKSWSEWFSGTSNNVIQGADNAVGSAANFISTGAQNTFSRASNLFSSSSNPSSTSSSISTSSQPIGQTESTDTQITSSQSTNSTPPVSEFSNSNTSVNPSVGGKRKRKITRRMKGGYKENLAYYAAPVHGLNVAVPTYWISAKTNPPLSGGSKRRLKKRSSRHKSSRHKSSRHKK